MLKKAPVEIPLTVTFTQKERYLLYVLLAGMGAYDLTAEEHALKMKLWKVAAKRRKND